MIDEFICTGCGVYCPYVTESDRLFLTNEEMETLLLENGWDVIYDGDSFLILCENCAVFDDEDSEYD